MLDLRGRLSAERGQQRLARLANRVPGFRGYARQEARRETDRLLRAHIADRLIEQRRNLEDLQAALVDANLLRDLPPVEAALVRLQTLADEVRTGSYGYAGWFTAANVGEAELDAIYDHDLALAEGVDWIASHLRRLADAVAGADETAFGAVLDDLNDTVDRLAEGIVRRREAISAARQPPSPLPQRLWAAAKAAFRTMRHLPQLGPGDGLRLGGVDYVVAGRVDYHQDGKTWQAYLLQNGEERWLWTDDGGRRVHLAVAVPPPEDMEGRQSIDWGGEELALAESGSAVADVETPVGRQSLLPLEYRRFLASSGRTLWVERRGDIGAAFLGEPIEAKEIEVWQRPKGR